MTRIFTTGAEEASPGELWDGVADEIGATNSDYQNIFGYTKTSTIKPRTGRGMLALTSSTYLTRNFSENETEIFIGIGVNFPLLTTIDFLWAYTQDPTYYSQFLQLKLMSDGKIQLLRSNSILATSTNPVFTNGTWYYVEAWFKPRNSSGSAVVKVDGTEVISYTGDTTNDKEYMSSFRLAGVIANQSYGATYYDDIVVNNAEGSYNNSYPGIVYLLPIREESDGTYGEWDRGGIDFGSDSANARNGTFDLTMLQTTSGSKKVTFVPEIPVLGTSASITNIVLSARGRVEGGSGSIAPILISGSTIASGGSQTLLSTWGYYQEAWAYNPDTSGSWVESDLSSLEIGVSS